MHRPDPPQGAGLARVDMAQYSGVELDVPDIPDPNWSDLAAGDRHVSPQSIQDCGRSPPLQFVGRSLAPFHPDLLLARAILVSGLWTDPRLMGSDNSLLETVSIISTSSKLFREKR